MEPPLFTVFTSVISLVGRSTAQATLLGLIVLAVHILLRNQLSARWRYALWLPVLVRLLLPSAPESSWSLFNFVRWPQRDLEARLSIQLPQYSAADLDPAGAQGIDLSPSSLPTPAAQYVLTWNNAFLAVWLAGAIFFGLRILRGNWRVRRCLHGVQPLHDPETEALFAECRQVLKVKQRASIYSVPGIDAPSLYGCFRPRLLLPTDFRQRFTIPEMRHILLHETAHLKRHDVLVNLFLLLAEVIHWFNPFVRYFLNRMRADRELASDEAVLAVGPENDRMAYGETILKTIESLQHYAPLPGLVGIGDAKNQLEERIRGIARFRGKRKANLMATVLIALLCVLGLSDAQSTPLAVAPIGAKQETTLPSQSIESPKPDAAPTPRAAVNEVGVPLYTRSFRLDPNTFLRAIGAGAGTSPTMTNMVQTLVRDYFAAAGIDFSVPPEFDPYNPAKPSPIKAIFFNVQTGVLFVRASLRDLNIVETMIQRLNVQPLQMTIEAKIVELPRKELNWLNEFVPAQGNRKRRAGTNQTAEARILTDQQFRAAIKRFERSPGVDLLATPRVTTLSGRQAQIAILEQPTDEEAKRDIPATGPTIEFFPRVQADGKTIQMDVDFKLVEKVKKTGWFSAGSDPKIRKRQLATTTTLADGQTALITGVADERSKESVVVIFVTATLIDPAGNRLYP